MTELAAAKINLCLHVTGQRADGYHLLDSLVVFAELGDRLTFTAADDLRLTLGGPQAANLPANEDNLILRAARAFGVGLGAHIHLEKHLPIASGIGGGSADAAAALRGLSRLWGLPLPDAATVLALGADVPVCLSGNPLRMQGVGEVLTPLPPLPHAHLVLVNPGVAIPTPTVFRALANKINPALPDVPRFANLPDFAAWLTKQRNDLETPAVALAPQIAVAKTALAAQAGCHLARMSGSGATCFGMFATAEQAEAAVQIVTRAQPRWWVQAGPMLS
jgi:4-diphosphocytidyl-2-C-methyl-D-erythritol kinase